MGTEIIVNVTKDDDGTFVAAAVGIPGVIASGSTQQEAVARIENAWRAMAQFDAIKGINPAKHAIYRGKGGYNQQHLRLKMA